MKSAQTEIGAEPLTGHVYEGFPFEKSGYSHFFLYANNNPINEVDLLGLLTEVIIWQPVGKGESSFGHVSVNINGTSYSFGPWGMDIRPSSEYLSRNAFREGVGTELNLNPCEETRVEQYLRNYRESYSFPFLTCVTPILEGLTSIGYDLGTTVFPVSLGNAILDSSLVKRIDFYEATKPTKGWSAPWAK